MRWWSRLGLRGRLTLIAVAGLAIGLTLGGVLLVYALQATLQRTLDDSALDSGRQVAALARAGKLPDPIPAGERVATIQVVDGADRIVATSAGADRLVPVLHGDEVRDARNGKRFDVSGDRAGLATPLRVVGVPAGHDTVLVAVSRSELSQSVGLVRNVLLIAFPLLVAILGLVAWRAVGWTLRPVEALRRGAEDIANEGSAASRLPAPATGDEVARLATTLNGMLARLADSQGRQRAFVADAAHELRSPVASIRTQLEVAQRLGDRADWPDVLRDLLVDTDRLSRLTEDLLLLARSADPDDAARRIARRSEQVDLAALVRDVADRYDSARVPVVAHADEPVEVHGDPAALARVVGNLLDNAVRHAETEATAAVSVVDGRASVVVADDGPGIPPADRDRVFDRFTRLDDARARDEGGSGLGLAIVAELVAAHHGTVDLTAAPGPQRRRAGRPRPPRRDPPPAVRPVRLTGPRRSRTCATPCASIRGVCLPCACLSRADQGLVPLSRVDQGLVPLSRVDQGPVVGKSDTTRRHGSLIGGLGRHGSLIGGAGRAPGP